MIQLAKGETLRFSVMAHIRPGMLGQHTSYQVEAFLNTGLSEHLKTCKECREIISKDLRDFAKQIEEMK